MSIIVIHRDFLNHDQTGSCESIVFIKGRKKEWKGMQIRFFASTILYRRLCIQVLSLKRTFSLVPYVCLYLERGTEKRTTLHVIMLLFCCCSGGGGLIHCGLTRIP